AAKGRLIRSISPSYASWDPWNEGPQRRRFLATAKDGQMRLNTGAQCEKEHEHIVNGMKVAIPDPRDKKNNRRIYPDPNRGKAIVNAIRVSLQSKKDTEDLDLKRGETASSFVVSRTWRRNLPNWKTT